MFFLRKAAVRLAQCILFVSVGASAHAQQKIKIGVVYPLTGVAASTGAELKHALELAADVINNGAKIFNENGDHAGCYRLYQGSLLSVRPFLVADLQKRIVRALDVLADNPRPSGVVKMAGDDDLWRLRVGDFRIVYEIHDDVLLVMVLRIGHRREVYRD